MNKRILRILAVLEQLHAVHPNGLALNQLLVGMSAQGFTDETQPSLASLMEDMTSQSLCICEADRYDATLKRWKRLEAGRVMLAEHNRI
jgi:hypothetical protein